MALKLESTGNIDNKYIKMLVYGHPGAGKTYAIRTLEDPFIISCEGGLLSLRDVDVPYVNIHNENEFLEILSRIANAKDKKYKTIVLDSLSELADLILLPQKKIAKDPRQAYGYVQDALNNYIRSLCALPYNIYLTSKAERVQDEEGVLLYSPMMPGTKLSQSIPYLFDEVLAMKVKEEKTEDGGKVKVRYLQTDSDGKWHAKDRSGRLDMFEIPDMQNIINKCLGVDSND